MASNSLLPTFMLGIGDFGAQVLAALSEQLSHAYDWADLESISMLAVGSAEVSPASTIPYYSVYSDATSWLDESTDEQALSGWFLPANYGRQQLTRARLAELDSRQLMRLMFLKHLEQKGHELVNFLRRDVSRVLHDRRSSDANVYLLAALDQTETTALLLDLASVLRQALTRDLGRDVRLIGFLALPSALPQPKKRDQQERIQAQAFACLRELEQSSLTFHVPPTAAKLEPDRRCPINFVRLYGDRIEGDEPSANLAACWVDALLPQLDSRFGKRFIQENWINLPAVISSSEHSGEMLVGTQAAYAAVFPRRHVLNLWVSQLACEALDQHLQLEHSVTDWQSEIERWAYHQSPLMDSAGYTVYSPRLLSRLLALDRSEMSIRQLAQMDGTQLVSWICGLDDAYGDSIRQIAYQQSSTLHWMPDADNAFNLSGADAARWFCEQMEKSLKAYFGAFGDNPDGENYSSGSYHEVLHQAGERQKERFDISLLVLSRYLLDRIGVVNTLTALEGLADDLRESQQVLAEASTRQRQVNTLIAQLRRYSVLIHDLTERPFPGASPRPSRDVKRYVTAAVEISAVLKVRIALGIVEEITAGFIASLEMLIARLSQWQQVFWPDVRALYAKTHQAKADCAALVNGQDVLFDHEWALAYYVERIYPYLPSLAAHLSWQITARTSDTAPITTAQIELVLDGKALLIPTHDQHFDENYRRWMNEARAIVESVTTNLSLWDYILRDADHRIPLISAIHQQPSSLLTGHFSERTVSQKTFLFEPTAVKQAAEQTQVLDQLHQRLETYMHRDVERFKIGSRAHIIAFTNTDLIPLRETEGYRQSHEAYAHLSVRKRQQLHIFPREAMAAALEADLKQSGLVKQPVMLSPRVVALIANRPRLIWFVWADTLKWVRKLEYNDVSNRYALVLPNAPSEPWWLGEPSANPDFEQAVSEFCLSEQLVSPSEHATAVEDLDLNQEIAAAVRVASQPYVNAETYPQVDYWDWARSLRHQRQWSWALDQAMRTSLMQMYHEQCLTDLRNARPEQYDLLLVLAQISKALLEEYRKAIRKKLTAS